MARIGSKERLYKLPCSVGDIVEIDKRAMLFTSRYATDPLYTRYKVISFTISNGTMTAKLKPMWITRTQRRYEEGPGAEYYERIPASAIGGPAVKLKRTTAD